MRVPAGLSWPACRRSGWAGLPIPGHPFVTKLSGMASTPMPVMSDGMKS